MPIAESVCHDLGPAAELVALPGIGHFPLEEAPEDSVRAIVRFLDAVAPGERGPVQEPKAGVPGPAAADRMGQPARVCDRGRHLAGPLSERSQDLWNPFHRRSV